MTTSRGRTVGASQSDIYCAGFITKDSIPDSIYVQGNLYTPNATRLSDRDTIFLHGRGLKEGDQYEILREIKSPDNTELYKGQRAAIGSAGRPYAELGRVKVVSLRGDVAIAEVQFSCDAMTLGDIAIPFQQKPPVAFRPKAQFDRFAPPNGKLTARIVMAKDFDYVVANGQKVYLNAGSSQGVNVGDYFRAVRTYESTYKDPVDSLSFKASITEDTQKHPPSMGSEVPFSHRGGAMRISDLPRRSLGEMVVLGVTPSSSTAMITFALEEIQVGDMVEMEEPLPPAPPAPPAPPPQPPTISCMASPVSVRPGQNASVNCEASSPDNRPLSFSFTTDRGRVTANANIARLDTTDLPSGPVTVTGTVTDDRNLSASSTAAVTVEAPPPPPTASKLNELQFRAGSARVDNAAKAVLDDVALRLQQDPQASAMVVGFADSDTPAGKRLAADRANNVKTYLSKSKGIDPGRVQVRSGANHGNKAEIWFIPAGANIPQ